MKLNEWWYRFKPLMGVDIGSRTIKGVRLKVDSKGKYKLSHHFFQDLANTSENYPLENNLEDAIRAAIDINRLKSTHSASAVKDSEMVTFSFELQKMTEKELIETVPLEMVDHATVPLDDYLFDFTASVKNEMNEIKVYGVRKELVLEQIQLLKKSGLKPRSIESEMIAIRRMLQFNEYLRPEEVVVVIDLGESSISTGLIVNQELLMTRSKGFSFSQVNQAIREQNGNSYEEAESLMASFDFLENQEQQDETTLILERSFTEVLKEIREIIEFYQECPESMGKIDQILLVGGGTQFKNIELIHETYFKIPTKIVNPFRNIEIMNDENPELNEEMVRVCPFMGVAVGLALSNMQDSSKWNLKEKHDENSK